MLLFMVLSPNYHDFPFSCDFIMYQHYFGKKNISRFSILLDCQSIMSFRCAVPMYAMSRVGSLLQFGCPRFYINQLMVIYTSLLHSKKYSKKVDTHSQKPTSSQKMGRAPKGNDRLPTIHCQVLPLMETSCTTVWTPVNTAMLLLMEAILLMVQKFQTTTLDV